MSAVSSAEISFGGALALRDGAAVAARLTAALAQPGPLTIDATGVTAADMAIVQILVAARKSALAAGKPFELRIGRSGALRDLFSKAGFAADNGLPLPQHQGLWTFTDARRQAA